MWHAKLILGIFVLYEPFVEIDIDPSVFLEAIGGSDVMGRLYIILSKDQFKITDGLDLTSSSTGFVGVGPDFNTNLELNSHAKASFKF